MPLFSYVSISSDWELGSILVIHSFRFVRLTVHKIFDLDHNNCKDERERWNMEHAKGNTYDVQLN